MAKAVVSFCEVGGRTSSGGTVNAIRLKNVVTKVITTSSSNQVIDASATFRYSFVSITAVGGPVWVVGGVTPVASAAGILILDGQTKDFSLDKGDKIAVIDAVL